MLLRGEMVTLVKNSALWLLRRRSSRLVLLLLITITPLIFVASGSRSQDGIGAVVGGRGYNLVSWEFENVLDKWLHKITSLLPWVGRSQAEQLALVEEYFRLNREIASLEPKIVRATSEEGRETLLILREILEGRRDSIRDEVEETIEGQVSSVLSREGLSWKLPIIDNDGYLFPPVDFRFGEPPQVLAISPRDRIELADTRLLKPDLELGDIEEIEAGVEGSAGVSALVTGTGGIATYPSVIPNTGSLRGTLRTVAHEWVHHYMVFFPLGRNYFSSDAMTTLNETIADVIGNEVGDRVLERFYAAQSANQPSPSQTSSSNEDTFDFNREMRITRLRADELLAEGKIEEAEQYLEERRLFLAENGFYLRKLNQAYFAFHGTYAARPTSVSPIGGQVEELRTRSSSLKDFVKTVSGVSNHEELLGLLETR